MTSFRSACRMLLRQPNRCRAHLAVSHEGPQSSSVSRVIERRLRCVLAPVPGHVASAKHSARLTDFQGNPVGPVCGRNGLPHVPVSTFSTATKVANPAASPPVNSSAHAKTPPAPPQWRNLETVTAREREAEENRRKFLLPFQAHAGQYGHLGSGNAWLLVCLAPGILLFLAKLASCMSSVSDESSGNDSDVTPQSMPASEEQTEAHLS